MIGVWEIVAIVLVIVLFVGGKKIPELMKGVGKGVRSFKEGLNGIEDDVNRSGEKKKEEKDGSSSAE
ncbi:MAG TPA: twin-arginine translocase TatA/TatE family subunit [Candidatus Cryptobacteroides pullicola]|nr:twin-arginine translocase TatA/TatE family subunit [Candidatus Cryptobacteroides pullicola]